MSRLGILDDWLTLLEQRHPSKIDLSLERIRCVWQRLMLPVNATVVTVAGTNGKGSTCYALECLARRNHCTVGSYSSPHIHRFNERIRIQGQPVSDADIIRAFERIEEARSTISLTYFEFATLAALIIFAEAKLDLWILEVGLGGRLDATNIIDADVAIITTIDLDHQQFLGDTRDKIALEKAGIIKPQSRVIVACDDPPKSLIDFISERPNPRSSVGLDINTTIDEEGRWCWQYGQYRAAAERPQLPQHNLAAALATWCQLSELMQRPVIDIQADLAALSQLTMPGRWQMVSEAPALLVDVGHNPQAARYLANRLACLCQHKKGSKLAIILGMQRDKNIVETLRPFVGLDMYASITWFVIPLPPPRGATATELSTLLAAFGGQVVIACDDGSDALLRAINYVEKTGLIFAFGSFLTVESVLNAHAQRAQNASPVVARDAEEFGQS